MNYLNKVITFYPRYNLKSGCPADFITYLKSVSLTPGIILRYVGNRIHVIYHMAGTVVWIHDQLVEFLSKYSSAKKLGSAVLADLRNPDIMVQLQILGLLGKLLTGPWMVLFYKNALKKRNLEMRPEIMSALVRLSEIEVDPSLLLSTKKDLFGHTLPTDDRTLIALRNAPSHERFNSLAVILVKSAKTVLDRQLERYTTGDLSSPTPEMFDICSSADVNNFHAERVLGKFSAQWARAPNATTGFLDAKTKAATNHTLDFLIEKPPSTQASLITFSRKAAGHFRKELSVRSVTVDKEKLKRQRERAQKNDTKERNKVDRKIKGMLASEDVDGLVGEVKGGLKELVRNVLEKGDVEGVRIRHVWRVDDVDVEFLGVLLNVKDVKGKRKVQIKYYQEGQTSVFEEIDIHIFITDTVVGDLHLDS